MKHPEDLYLELVRAWKTRLDDEAREKKLAAAHSALPETDRESNNDTRNTNDSNMPNRV